MQDYLEKQRAKLEDQHLKSVDEANDNSKELIKQQSTISTVLLALVSIFLTTDLFIDSVTKTDIILVVLILLGIIGGLSLSVWQVYTNLNFWTKHAYDLKDGMQMIYDAKISEEEESDFVENVYNNIFQTTQQKSKSGPLIWAYILLSSAICLFFILILRAVFLGNFELDNKSRSECQNVTYVYSTQNETRCLTDLK